MTYDPENPPLTEKQLSRAVDGRVIRRIRNGRIESGKDAAVVRKYLGLTQEAFARALEVNVGTIRNWEQELRMPSGPALALLRIAARHPRVILEALKRADAA